MPLILPGNVASALPTGYDVANSCRFNGDAYMHKTYGSAGNVDRWTFSAWFKIASSSGNICLFAAAADSNNYGSIVIKTDGSIEWQHYASASAIGILHTNRKLRDYSAWYNLICVYDSANGTAGDRMKMYINGTEETSFNTDTNPSSGQDSPFNKDDKHVIGAQDYAGGSFQNYWKGYLAEVVFLDGTAASATDLGEFDDDSPTIWKPKDVSGLTFGSNGFYLDFEDSGDLDDDESGESNDYTAVSLAAADQAVDTPTNNFCTLNPLIRLGTHSTLSEGNCYWTLSSAGYESVHSTFAVNSGRWYCEFKFISGSHQYTGITASHLLTGLYESVISGDSNIMYNHAGNKQIGNSSDGAAQSSYGSTYTSGDIIGMALDYDNNYMYFAKNNTCQDSGDPTSGASGTGGLALPSTTHSYAFGMSKYASGGSGTAGANFGGCPPFSLSSAANDENGYGLFEHAPPDGFLALCSKNLGSDGG